MPRMRHAAAADGLTSASFDDALFSRERELAGGPAAVAHHPSRASAAKSVIVLCLNPLAPSGIGAGSCFAPFRTQDISPLH
jgi:hypothetical protein